MTHTHKKDKSEGRDGGGTRWGEEGVQREAERERESESERNRLSLDYLTEQSGLPPQRGFISTVRQAGRARE